MYTIPLVERKVLWNRREAAQVDRDEFESNLDATKKRAANAICREGTKRKMPVGILTETGHKSYCCGMFPNESIS